MNYEIVTLQEKTVVGKSIMTTNENGQSMTDIGGMWQQFIGGDVLSTIQNKTDGKGIGLYTDYEGDATKPYRFMCCVEVSQSGNTELETRTISGGKYAKFTVKGNVMTAVGEAWEKIWNMDLDRKFDCDFELYHYDSEDMDNQTIDIYISLK